MEITAFRPAGITFSESEIEAFLCKNPEALEEGLELITNQYRTPENDRIDLLCLDSENALVIVELKVVEDNGMLFQGLRYYSHIERIKPHLKLHYAPKIETSKAGRLLLVAPSFSDVFKEVAGLLSQAINIKLLEYYFFRTNQDKYGLTFREVRTQAAPTPTEPRSLENHLSFIKDSSLRSLCQEVIDALQKEGMVVRPVQSYIGFWREGEIHANIWVKRGGFYVRFFSVRHKEWREANVDSSESAEETLRKIEGTGAK